MSILVLNLGLKSVRCIAFSFDGRVLSQSSQPIHTFVSNQRVEQDPIEWRKSSWQVIQDVSNNLGQKKEYVRFITVTTSASCLVPLDNQGNPISNAILVSDTRSVDEARLLAHTVEFQTVQNESGMKSSPDLMLPKIMWLARHEPGIFKRTAFFVNAGDFLIMQLTGRCVTDPNNAA